jgi:ubiquinone/menaquinone biosynthesis C-methylase UbiE
MQNTSQLRVTRSHAQARAAYNAMSGFYDRMAGSSERKYKLIGLALLAVQPGERVLEIGAGTGQCLPLLANAAGGQGLVCGMDHSDGMLRVTQNRLRKNGLSPAVQLQCADALHLPYASHSFDALFLSFTLELFDTPEIPPVLAECRRVLKPIGRLSVAAMCKQEHVTSMEKLYEWAHTHFEAWADCRPIVLQPALQAAGFQIHEQVDCRMFGLPVSIVLAGIS